MSKPLCSFLRETHAYVVYELRWMVVDCSGNWIVYEKVPQNKLKEIIVTRVEEDAIEALKNG